MKKNKSGFTLMELLITVTLVILLVASSFPFFTSLINSFKERNLVEEISLDLNEAKILAVSSNRDIDFKFYYIGGYPSWEISSDGNLIKKKEIDSSNIYVNFSTSNIKFSTLGFLQTSNGTNLTNLNITICQIGKTSGTKISLNSFSKQKIEDVSC